MSTIVEYRMYHSTHKIFKEEDQCKRVIVRLIIVDWKEKKIDVVISSISTSLFHSKLIKHSIYHSEEINHFDVFYRPCAVKYVQSLGEYVLSDCCLFQI